MTSAAKLLLVAGIGRDLYGKWRAERMVTVAVTVLMLTVTAAVMLGVLATGGIFTVYLLLRGQGMEIYSALLAAALMALFFTALLLAEIRRRLRTLKSPAGASVKETVDAFFDGLCGE